MINRRRLIRLGGGVGVITLAGCNTILPEQNGSADSPTETPTVGPETETSREFPPIEQSREEKHRLAQRIDAIATDIQEEGRVDETLQAVSEGVREGRIPEEKASESVERMKLGEYVTETLLAGMGPDVAEITPDQFGENPAANPELNISGDMVESSLNLLTVVFLSDLTFNRVARHIPNRFRKTFDTAKQKLAKVIDWAADTFLGRFDELAEQVRKRASDIAEFVLGFALAEGAGRGVGPAKDIVEELLVSGDGDNRVLKRILNVREALAQEIVAFYEDDLPGKSIDDKLVELDESLGPSEVGTIELEGSFSGATRGSEVGITETNRRLTLAKRVTDAIERALRIVDGLEVIVALILATGFLSVASLTVELAFLLVHIGGNLMGIGTGAFEIGEAIKKHHQGLDTVITGGR